MSTFSSYSPPSHLVHVYCRHLINTPVLHNLDIICIATSFAFPPAYRVPPTALTPTQRTTRLFHQQPSRHTVNVHSTACSTATSLVDSAGLCTTCHTSSYPSVLVSHGEVSWSVGYDGRERGREGLEMDIMVDGRWLYWTTSFRKAIGIG